MTPSDVLEVYYETRRRVGPSHPTRWHVGRTAIREVFDLKDGSGVYYAHPDLLGRDGIILLGLPVVIDHAHPDRFDIETADGEQWVSHPVRPPVTGDTVRLA